MKLTGTPASCPSPAQPFQVPCRQRQRGERRTVAAGAAAARFRRGRRPTSTAGPTWGRGDAQRLLEERKLRRAALADGGAGERAGDLGELHERAKRLRAVVADAEVVAVEESVAASVDGRGGASRPLAQAPRARAGALHERRGPLRRRVQVRAGRAGEERPVRGHEKGAECGGRED